LGALLDTSLSKGFILNLINILDIGVVPLINKIFGKLIQSRVFILITCLTSFAAKIRCDFAIFVFWKL